LFHETKLGIFTRQSPKIHTANMKILACLSFILLSWDSLTAVADECQGYTVTKKSDLPDGFEADLDIVRDGCATFGPDVAHLRLKVEYQTDSRLRVLVQDRECARYQVPEDIFPTPRSQRNGIEDPHLSFRLTESPFSFQVIRSTSNEVIFDTTGSPFIFQRQYIKLQTKLPENPNIYGLGEHIDSFRLPTRNYTRTLWNRDSDGVPYGENLYSSHPVYFEHRLSGTHGVFLLNSNAMDVRLDQEDYGPHILEYITSGGVLDLYFLAGPSPVAVSRQYAAIAGRPAMIPYWALGFHQCKFGYQDWFQVAEVVLNYSRADIPLETMWTDIDYMERRRVFSLDNARFPIDRMRDLVQYLHLHQQYYILMVDPAIAVCNDETYKKAAELGILLKLNESAFVQGVVWPGVAVFPDWYHPGASSFWVERFKDYFSPEKGIDIDGVWSVHIGLLVLK
jgi:alpha-glucosidase